MHGLIKSYGNVQALFGVDLDVKRGEVFGMRLVDLLTGKWRAKPVENQAAIES